MAERSPQFASVAGCRRSPDESRARQAILLIAREAGTPLHSGERDRVIHPRYQRRARASAPGSPEASPASSLPRWRRVQGRRRTDPRPRLAAHGNVLLPANLNRGHKPGESIFAPAPPEVLLNLPAHQSADKLPKAQDAPARFLPLPAVVLHREGR